MTGYPNYEALSSPDAERSLIGAALLRGSEIFEEAVIAQLLPGHFTVTKAIDAWKEILAQKSLGFDEVTVENALRNTHGNNIILWLGECVNVCPSAYNANAYATIIWDFARKRKAHQVITMLGAAIFNGNFEQSVEEAIKTLTKIKQARLKENK